MDSSTYLEDYAASNSFLRLLLSHRSRLDLYKCLIADVSPLLLLSANRNLPEIATVIYCTDSVIVQIED